MQQTDIPQENAPQENVPQADAPQENVPQTDAPQENAPQADAPQADVTQGSVPQADAPQAGTPQADGEQKKPFFPRKKLLNLLSWLCGIVFLLSILYLANWYAKGKITEEKNKQAAEMYERIAAMTEAPTATPKPTTKPTATPKPTEQPTEIPIPTDIVLAPPDPNTLVLVLTTPPPVQSSFRELIETNGETAGYLEAADWLSLPVMQRLGDNDYYLTHDYTKKKSDSGALFLDGVNTLYPKDSVMIIYGHNMVNGEMFNKLSQFNDEEYMCRHPIVYFDTIYENGTYVPFAVFSASMDSGNERYFNLRQFGMNEDRFNAYVEEMLSRSEVTAPIDVEWGDELLLLVTCSYDTKDARLVVALRALRPDEGRNDTEKLYEEYYRKISEK